MPHHIDAINFFSFVCLFSSVAHCEPVHVQVPIVHDSRSLEIQCIVSSPELSSGYGIGNRTGSSYYPVKVVPLSFS